MNLRKFLLVLPLFVTLLHLSVLAQRDSIPLTTIIDKTMKFTTGRPTEKVYLQFDKPYYAVNDTLWVKAYVTTDLHVPSALSKILYIDFINEQNTAVDELKLRLVNGEANGYLQLNPAFYKKGNYRIRAYTRWMRNFDQAYFFNKTISVGSNDQGQVIPQISFKNAIAEKSSKINAKVVYKNEDGNPYANKKVNWKVTNDDDVISKGKGETDKDGALNISFITDKTSALSTSIISTELEIADKDITKKSFLIEMTPPGIDVQFFPEGGYMVNGIRSRVAFKATKPDGLGIDAKGTIVDNTGNVMASFSSQHLGMGIFALLPEKDKTYKANLTFADGTSESIDLPTPRDEGFTLSLNNANPDTLSIKMVANDGFFQKNQNKSFYVVAQSNGIVCYAAQTVLRNSVYSAAVPKSKFPTGIVQVTLFSVKGSPLSERIAFIQHNDQLGVTMKSDRSSYSRKQKVRMLVSAKNKALPDEANFSVSVIDESIVPYDEDDETSILSHLLLTSDLRGYIEKPNYYFIHQGEQVNSDLDVLMLTQGYRRFSYKNIIADKNPPVTFLPEEGIDISGTLRTNTGIPVAKGNVRLFIPDKGYSTQTVTDMSGNFVFSNILVSDSSRVTLNARDNSNGSNMVLTLNGVITPPSTQYVNPAGRIANIDSTLRPYLQNAKKQFNIPRALKGVVIKAAPNEKKVSHQDFSTLSGLSMLADHVIPGSNFNGCPVFFQCLATQSLGISSDQGKLYLTRDYNAGGRTPISVFVSGLEVDFSYLNSLDANMVESVEVFNTDGFSGINRTGSTKGVMEINMKKQPKGEKISREQLMDMMPKTYLVEFTPGGYNSSRLFYVPKYDNPATNNAVTDLRSTIYWSPNVVTDKTGNASFEFYNGDNTGTFKAIIEGIDKDGNIGRFVYRYNVQ